MYQMSTHLEMPKIAIFNTFPNSYKLITVADTDFKSSVTCERAISNMRNVEKRSRSTMMHKRFRNYSA